MHRVVVGGCRRHLAAEPVAEAHPDAPFNAPCADAAAAPHQASCPRLKREARVSTTLSESGSAVSH